MQSMDLLSVISENLIRSITLQVDVEKLTHELVLEIHNQFVNEKGDLPLNFILYDGRDTGKDVFKNL